ncbi:MAG: phosphatidate cytidylyltransferase [Symploca sp. SIO1B1]|nr:phosphatidate cytidylyltransferase [Symploca sp. SIO1B1]
MLNINHQLILIFERLIIVSSIGTVLVATLFFVYKDQRDKVIKSGQKLINLLSIILLFFVTGLIGKWAVLPVILVIGFYGWVEFINAIKHYKSSESNETYQNALIICGLLGISIGLLEFSIVTFIMFITLIWVTVIGNILIVQEPSPLYITLGTTFGMVFITFPLIILLNLVSVSYEEFILLIALVMGNDGFAQAFGQLLGKTPLVPQISNNKTIEGSLGGLISCLFISYLSYFLFPEWELWQLLLLSGIISIFCLLGDLMASSLKREVGIKDFGKILGATGGMLDKFDSLLFATPIFYLIVYLYDVGL